MHRYSMYIIKQSPLFVNIFWKLFLLLWLYFIYPLSYNQFAVFLLQLKGGVHQCIYSHHFYYICKWLDNRKNRKRPPGHRPGAAFVLFAQPPNTV